MAGRDESGYNVCTITEQDDSLSDWNNEIQRIDREIAELHEVEDAAKIVDLKFTRNSLLPAHRVPNEILSEIFLFCSDRGCTWSMLPSWILDKWLWGWILVTQVCQQWRMVALDTAILWSSPNFSHPDWAFVMLDRSRTAPLKIQYSPHNIDPKVLKAMEQALVVHIARVSNLSLGYAEEEDLQHLLSSLGPTPLLRELTLKVHESSFTGSPTILPVHFHESRLTSLSIENLHVSWTDPFFSTLFFLTDLRISLRREAQTPSDTELFHILQQLPGLRKLELDNALRRPMAISSSSLSHQYTNLPKLQYLRVCSTTIPTFIGFLDRIRFPVSTIIHYLNSRFSDLDPESDFEELLLLARKFAELLTPDEPVPHRHGGPEGIRSLVLSNDFPLSFEAWTHGVENIGPVEESIHALATLDSNDMLAGLLSSLRLRNLESLRVSLLQPSFPVAGTTFSTSFGHLKSLFELGLDAGAARKIFPTLCETIKGALSYPNLTWLDLEAVDFRGDPSLLESLLHVCEYRRQRGHTIPYILLHNCNISKAQSTILRHRLTKETLEVVQDEPPWYWNNPDEESETEE
ncbi:hypothetical protein VNI00_004754 [Paramarasmius palmivorus]|uniref:F-box domain-containing protein n=1 Tax=Paramarasmius palmivorus TaxID=297713 RepID=A0AAW0DKE6_9AGAR